jgi:hypothetical protein
MTNLLSAYPYWKPPSKTHVGKTVDGEFQILVNIPRIKDPSPQARVFWEVVNELEAVGYDLFHFIALYIQAFSNRAEIDFIAAVEGELYEFFLEIFDTSWEDEIPDTAVGQAVIGTQEKDYYYICYEYTQKTGLITLLAEKIASICHLRYRGINIPVNFNPWEAVSTVKQGHAIIEVQLMEDIDDVVTMSMEDAIDIGLHNALKRTPIHF